MKAQYIPVLGIFLSFTVNVLSQCDGRRVLTARTGVITDGPGNYTDVANCEWLIDGNGNSTIYLKFHTMKTECSYDFLFVYDGKSYQNPLLASLSGDQLPPPLIATSGYMLIYFYSDRNYGLEGFRATYEIREDCQEGSCQCESGHRQYRSGCEGQNCPRNCSADRGQGRCEGSKACQCQTGFTGDDCAMSFSDGQGNNTWYMLSSELAGFRPRTSHAGAFIDSLNSFWIFGGFTLNEVLDELIFYNMSASRWEIVSKSSPWPEARYLHAMTTVYDGFAMYGGQLSNGDLSNELWHFNVFNLSWSLIDTYSDNGVLPKLSSHTLTLGKDWIYLFGGKTEQRFFSSEIYKIRIENLSEWERIFVKGGKKSSRRLAGHSAVYHKETNSIVIFGGHSTDNAQFSRLRNELNIFHIENSFWSMVVIDPQRAPIELPTERAYHSATILGDYMVVYAGNTHVYNKFELCYDAAIYFYHLGCHKWVSPARINKKFPAQNNGVKPDRRFGHVAVAAYGDTLLVSGGYSGFVLGDLLAFKVPPAIAVHQSISPGSYDHCNVYSKDLCVDDPACVVCDSPASLECVNRASDTRCTSRSTEAACPSFCPHLHSCDSCLNLGGQRSTRKGDNQWYYQRFHKCAWCVKEAECQPLHELSGSCTEPAYNTLSGQVGWWNGLSLHLTELAQCLTEDKPAGLHFLRYRSPANFTYPDELTMIRKIDHTLEFKQWIERENKAGDTYTGRMVGYIYPLNASRGYAINVTVGVSHADISVYLSKDDNPENKELVAKKSTATFFNIIALRPDYSPLFPSIARGHKYYLELNATQRISGSEKQPKAQVQFQRNSSTNSYQAWTFEFLEPMRTNNCSLHYNCLACLADTACGWCTENKVCLHRDVSENPGQQSCGKGLERHLVLAAGDCPSCIDYVDCHSCVSDPLCEWVVDDLICFRRGRFSDSVRNVSACQAPCRTHKTCDTCLGGRNECAWCDNLKACFTFSEYMTRFMYGQCLKWLDWEARRDTKMQCEGCDTHTNCKDCMANFGCGWCSLENKPVVGRCLIGDFTGPTSGENCTAIMALSINVTENVPSNTTEPALWSYAVCPDIQECDLDLDDCHDNASCINTPDGYNCTCHRGFVGNGKDTCDKTCYHNCQEGTCSGPPDYICLCSLGWSGDACDIDCGCNNHSTCHKGARSCDLCQHNTAGDQCQFCQPGSYGDPKQPTGCLPCECNRHGDDTLGRCSNVTGNCFCRDDTEGKYCEHCKPGYYGDPIDGGKCYLECDDRKIVTNIKYGALGSLRGPWASSMERMRAYCLWILTVFQSVDSPALHQVIPTITLAIEPNMAVACPEDHVYVYDGLPHFAAGRGPDSSVLLGTFCGRDPTEIPSLTARSGILTVFYQSHMTQEHLMENVGFNASYYVNDCPLECSKLHNRECVNGSCVCRAGYRGDGCMEEICPNDCSGQGQCLKDGCSCNAGYVGPGCEVFLLPNMAVFQPGHPGDDPSVLSDLARMGHTMSKCGEESIYVYGGYSHRHGIMCDIYHYNTTSGSWSLIEPVNEDIPKGRYFHAAVCMPDMKTLYVYGGLVEQDGSFPKRHQASQELWKFGLESKIWTLEEGPKWVDTLAGHTMTQISDTKLIVIGGFSVQNYFSNKVYEYMPARGLPWQEYKRQTEGQVYDTSPVGVFGHTSVYHFLSNTIYVFGGYLYKNDGFRPSNTMYTFDLDRKEWNVIQPEPGQQPMPRYFHTAVGRKDDMVVIGGLDSSNEVTNSVMIYRFTCNVWINVSKSESVSVVGDLTPAMGLASLVMGEDIYIFGGYNGVCMGSLTKLTIPVDACQVVRDIQLCRNTAGCSSCDVNVPLQGNLSFCYSSGSVLPDSCNTVNATLHPGEMCTEARLNSRDCEQFTNCSQCLAVYPQFKQAERVCKWCSNCNVGRCVKRTDHCNKKQCPGVDQTEVTRANKCVELRCQATDCDKCKELENCVWTRQSKRTGEVKRAVTVVARFNGNCVEYTGSPNQFLPVHRKCPNRCMSFDTCQKCLDTPGAEGGAEICVWSEPLKQCFPQAAVPLLCTGGHCGYLIDYPWERSALCPMDCAYHTRCSTCLASAGCGWCAFGGKNGSGVCMAGGLLHPLDGTCMPGNVQLTRTQEVAAENRSLLTTEPIIWSFMTCPPENECENNHHNCNNETEDCQDTPDSYRCICKPGYAKAHEQMECVPVCHQGCYQGQCVRPDVCKCEFGWVGRNCSVECQCNHHSNCKSENETTVCTGCANNTMGPQCSLCKPFFVGDPRGGKSCVSCRSFCNNHTDICVSMEESVHLDVGFSSIDLSKDQLSYAIKRGPKKEDAVCVSCQHNTTSKHCQECLPGFFRIRQDDKLKQPCLRCQCNGHSATCDELTGDNCDCHNNTDTSCNKDSKEKKPCWQKQCSECKEYFMGHPTNGHQCYRHMTMDQDYCFDPNTQSRCSQDPAPLHQGRTVFFYVKPKYLNVNIRITVDVTDGAADVYLSPCDDAFLIDVDQYGFHTVATDPNYHIVLDDNSVYGFQRRSIGNCSHSDRSSFKKVELNANELNTFITVDYDRTLLLVRNVTFRLVITLPLDVHDLRSSQFYLLLQSRGPTLKNQTFGNLYVRQDQPRIDLFVFFSVFFSCFFLFLAKCVLLWKVKQTFDARRTRQQRAREMKDMASRPFARVLVYIEQEAPSFLQPSYPRRNLRLPKVRTNRMELQNHNTLQQNLRETVFNLSPIAIEPTDDGIAAVGTVILRLPGGASAPSKLTLGSALTTRLHSGPSGGHNQKVNLRRRYSASFA